MSKKTNLQTPDHWDEILNGPAGKTLPDHSKGQVLTTAELVRVTGYNPNSILNMKNLGAINTLPNGKWPAVETLGAMVRKLKEKQDQFSSDDKRRKNKAEADHAEIKSLVAAGETCLIEHAKQFWTDSRVLIRQAIERAEYLPKPDREKLLAEIAAIEFEELNPSE